MLGFPAISLALAAAILEAGAGYPAFVDRFVGHPVTWVGALITAVEKRLNRPTDPSSVRRAMGVFTLVLLIAVVSAASFAFSYLCSFSWFGTFVLAVVASSLIAQRSLYAHVADVALMLETQGLPAAREVVSLIVGRDTAALDESGVARAAIESLAENFSDGIVAPLLWLAVAGLPGGCFYKAVNTADSMIGHRTPRFAAFGWAAARLDDLVNLPASRLSAVLITIAAAGTKASPGGAFRAVRRDASRHRSPNAGWPESAMAGALGLRLAGPRVYGGVLVDDAFMGNGRRDARASDIRRALAVFRASCGATWGLLLMAGLILRF
jgi:adenosylcobinamide-phosphate synthase